MSILESGLRLRFRLVSESNLVDHAIANLRYLEIFGNKERSGRCCRVPLVGKNLFSLLNNPPCSLWGAPGSLWPTCRVINENHVTGCGSFQRLGLFFLIDAHICVLDNFVRMTVTLRIVATVDAIDMILLG